MSKLVTIENRYRQMTDFREKNWLQRNYIEIVILGFGIIAIHIFLFFSAFGGKTLDAGTASDYGDFIGGYIGSLFGLISVVFIFSTFKEQRKSSEIEKFETRFFELIGLHRDNVQEITLKSQSGKKIFVLLIREYREILKIAANTFDDSCIDKMQLLNISYITLFYGVGPNSSRILRSHLTNYNDVKVDRFIKRLNEEKRKVQKFRNFEYVPFEGHQSRLGHYYRHLYQSISYCHNKKIELDKYEYVKLIRAQLSNHEQALFALNCLSDIGKPWLSPDLIEEYQLIKNIPEDFFDKKTELNIKKTFPKVVFEFEE